MARRNVFVGLLHTTVLALVTLFIGSSDRVSASASEPIASVCTTMACASPCFCRCNEAAAGCGLHIECVCIAEK